MKTTLAYILIAVLILGFTWYHKKTVKHPEKLTLEVRFMKYACGDWNDDAMILDVDNEAFEYVIGKDIDPVAIDYFFTREEKQHKNSLKDYFWDNETQQFGVDYRIVGYLSKYDNFGCESHSPRFYIDYIERLDGSNRKYSKDFIL